MKVKIGKRRPDITKDLLEDLYTKKKLSMHQAAKFLDTSYRTVWKKLKKFDIKTRTISEANTKYPKLPFSNNLIEKAYMLGLRTGDISAKRNHKQIMVYTSTTHLAQFKMFKKTFGKYTHRIYLYIGSTPKGMKAWKISCHLHQTFDFLINKLIEIPTWILNDKKLFYSFLAGYSDCEGSWGIDKQSESKKTRLRFRINSTDKNILRQLKMTLQKLKYKARFNLERKADGKNYKKDIYTLAIAYKKDVASLAKILIKLSKHSEKIWKMSFILNNKERNWKDIKNQIVKFRKEVKRNRLNDMSTKLQLPYLPHAMKVEVEH